MPLSILSNIRRSPTRRFAVGVSRTEGEGEMTKHSAATLVWMHEEDDQLRAAVA
jgi:hypothetical protein